MSPSARLWAFRYFCTCLALASDPLQRLTVSATNASNSISNTSPLQIVTAPSQKSLFSVGSPPPSPSAFNATESSINARFTCSRNAYGSPDLESCMTTWNGIPDTTDVISFGEREAPEDWDVVVPFRFISVDGLCTLEIAHTGSGTSDRSSPRALKRAAFGLIKGCIEQRRMGGNVTGLGEHGRLSITIRQYEPHVSCSVPRVRAADLDRCNIVLADMPVSTAPKVFGRRGTAGIDVPLPISYIDPELQCAITVQMIGNPASSDWYTIWGAAVAVVGMCVAEGKDGTAIVQVGDTRFGVNVANYRPRLLLGNGTSSVEER